MDTFVPEYLKLRNRKVIFDLFQTHKNLSRADVVSMTNMSFPTVSKCIDFFISRSIIQETNELDLEMKGPGRKRQLLSFNPLAYKAICISFEGQIVEIGIIDLSYNVSFYEKREFKDFFDKEAQKELGAHIKELIKKERSVIGLGIALPTNIDPVNFDVVGFFSLGMQGRVSFKDLFSEFLSYIDIPFIVENDVNLAALGETALNKSGNDNINLCYLSLGTGFGSGIILNSHLWGGVDSGAGEIGNTILSVIPLDMDNFDDTPLENTISINQINKQFGINMLSDNIDEQTISHIIDFILPVLSTAVYNYVHVIDLKQFVMGGLTVEVLGKALITRLEKRVNDMLKARGKTISIKKPTSQYSSLIGGASLLFDNILVNVFH